VRPDRSTYDNLLHEREPTDMYTLHRWGAAIAIAAASAIPVLAVAGTASAAPGGNSAGAHACQQGGYLNLEGTDGTRFANVDACVSYAAHGGTLQALPPSISLAFTPTNSPNYCYVVVTLNNFAPNTTYPSSYNVNGFPNGSGPDLTTDANGNDTQVVFSFQKSTFPSTITYIVNDVNSPTKTVTC
jgi:hypothetical protein